MTADERKWLATQFDQERPRLVDVAYRMLGSVSEAEDAVQETWVRLTRTDAAAVENLGGWLTTVVGRVCLNVLRSRANRRESSMEELTAERIEANDERTDPEREALLGESVGLAMLVVLEALEPAERLAFVLHDMFGVPFDEIAEALGRSPAAARQLASRAQRRVRGTPATADVDLARQREVVDAFLAAARGGDFQALVSLLHPDVVLRADAAAVARGTPRTLRGAAAVAEATMFHRASLARLALVEGEAAVVVGLPGRVMLVLRPTIEDGRIVELEVVVDGAALQRLDVGEVGGGV